MKNNHQESDFDELINVSSENFDAKLYNKIIEKYGSIEEYKRSNEWNGISDIYKMVELLKRAN